MMVLFHGSDISVPHPLVKVGRDNLDFGKGFYLTSIKEQAESWASVIAERRGRNVRPVVNVYNFDKRQVELGGFRIKVFSEYNIDWLNYVVDCRQGKNVWQNFDVVEGGVANDNVIDTVEDYEKGVITAEQALGQLRYKKVNHQLCILNQIVADKYLSFVESVDLSIKEEK